MNSSLSPISLGLKLHVGRECEEVFERVWGGDVDMSDVVRL